MAKSEDCGYMLLSRELDYEPYVSTWLRGVQFDRWIDLGAGSGGPARRLVPSTTRERIAVDGVAPATADPDGWRVVVGDISAYLDTAASDQRTVMSLFDVIEHFPPDDGARLLDRICGMSGAQLVFTPMGFFPQDPSVRPDLDAHPMMWHRSGWGIHDFTTRGFVVASLPMYHRRRGALLALRCSSWSDADRAQVVKSLRAQYLLRVLTPWLVLRRLKDSLFYWFGDTPLYRRLRSLMPR